MPEHTFPKRLRLLRPPEFERVFAARQSVVDKMLTVYGLENQYGHPRIGLVVSRRIGNATFRNRWKRLLREAFRLVQHDLTSFDFVCIPRAGSEPELASLQQSLLRLASEITRKRRSSRPPNSVGDTS